MPLFAAGTILIPGADDDGSGNAEVATVLSSSNGATLGTLPSLPTAECGDILPSAVYALAAQTVPAGDVTSFNIYTPDDTLIISIPIWTPPTFTYEFSPIRTNGRDLFYFLAIKRGAGAYQPLVRAIDAAGNIGPTVWALASTTHGGPSAMAPSRDDTILYYGDATGAIVQSSAIKRHDLLLNVPLTDLVSAAAGFTVGRDLLVTDVGDVICTAIQSPGDWEVRRYDASGVLQFTYALPAGSATGDEIELGRHAGDESVFWVRTYPTSDTTRFFRFRVADGATLTDFTITDRDGLGVAIVPISCPFLIYAGGCPGVIDAPRIDGLPYVPPVADECAGTGERGAPRIGA